MSESKRLTISDVSRELDTALGEYEGAGDTALLAVWASKYGRMLLTEVRMLHAVADNLR